MQWPLLKEKIAMCFSFQDNACMVEEKQLTGIVDITTPQTKAHSKAGFYGLVYFFVWILKWKSWIHPYY